MKTEKVIKTKLIIIAILIFANGLNLSCNLNQRLSNDLDQRAKSEYRSLFEEHFSSSGDSYYSASKNRLIRLKKVNFEVVGDRQLLTEADNANHLEWNSKIEPKAVLSKIFENGKGCSNWRDGIKFNDWVSLEDFELQLSLEKRNGKWKILNDDALKDFKKVEFSSLPECLTTD